MSLGPSFIGFEPEDKAKAMKTLTKVIELKEKNRIAAEESRGFEVAEEEKYDKRFKPIVDAISSASGEILKYNNEKDVKFAAKEVIDAVSQLKISLAQSAADPTNQGFVALVNAYRAQAMFAQSKLNYLDTAEKYSTAAPGAARQAALASLQTARDNYANALSAFQNIQIPIGFKQTVSIQQPPEANSVFPGANLQVLPNPQNPTMPPPQTIAKVPAGVPPPPPAPKLVAKPKGAPTPKTPKTPKTPASPQTQLGLPSEKWAADLLALRATDQIPAVYRNASQNVGGTLAIIELPKKDGDSVKLYLNDPTEQTKRPAELVAQGPILVIRLKDFNGKDVQLLLEDYLKKLMTFPTSTLNEKDVEGVIMLHAQIFGGWGKAFWGEDLKTTGKSLFMQKILKNPKYKMAVDKVKTTPAVAPVKQDVGYGLKFKTKATPKASVMRLGPDGEYGNLVIDVQALYNDGMLVARERGDQYGSNMSGGAVKLQEQATPGIKNLITKRAMQTTIDKASKPTQAQLKRLRKLAGFLQSKKVKGSGVGGIIVVDDVPGVMERLKVACGVFDAGNRSKKNAQLISELASKLMELKAIDESEYARILEKYKPE